MILLYHRVADELSDPYLLAVSPERFAEHMAIVRSFGEPMSLTQLGSALRDGALSRRTVAVTFDDGYADNFHNAKPVLEHYEVPGTFFVTSGYVGRDSEFWWDELERTLFQPGTLPLTLRLVVNGRALEWKLGDAATYDDAAAIRNRSWNVLAAEDPTQRQRLCRLLGDCLRPLAETDRQNALAQLRAQAGTSAKPRASHRALSLAELSDLASSPFVEIGAHSIYHAQMSARPKEEQRTEITGSKARMEAILKRPVHSFAYPFGGLADYTAETIDVVREAGFLTACSSSGGLVTGATSPYELPRFMVMNWNGDEFARRLRSFWTEP